MRFTFPRDRNIQFLSTERFTFVAVPSVDPVEVLPALVGLRDVFEKIYF
jgi:hypothetical protein